MHSVIYVLLRRLRYPLIVLIGVYAIAVLGFTLIPGQDDEGNVWHMSFFHAFYFVSFMGSTIGFGEIPYAFTDAQRAWTMVGIYSTVIAWLYGIGSLLTTLQDSSFQALLKETAFKRQLNKINESFYIICGYGDTGKLLLRALDDAGIRTVVIDHDEQTINMMALDDFRFSVPALCGDAGDPEVLLRAGLWHKKTQCAGVISLTDDDDVNLRIALSTHLLNPEIPLISRVETEDAGKNISSFGNNTVINPYKTFAGRLALALHSPGIFVLLEWMTGVPGEKLSGLVMPPRGRWILCGYGRFGKAVEKSLLDEGMEATLVDNNPEETNAPEWVIKGRGTEASTLQQADIENATGIVAGTNNDANNLSILMTAKDLKPDLFSVGRQNSTSNTTIFQAAESDLVMESSNVIAHKIFALIRTPLIGSFVTLASQQTNDWANVLVSRVAGVSVDHVPDVWEMNIGIEHFLRSMESIENGKVRLRDLYRDPKDRDSYLPCIPLLLQRGNQPYLTPSENTLMEEGDRILFCGRGHARRSMDWVAYNDDVLKYVLTGEEHPSGLIWKWYENRKKVPVKKKVEASSE